MGTLTVREARSEDLETLCRLYHEFHQFHAAGVPDRLLELGAEPAFDEAPNLQDALRGIIASEDAALFVAETDETVIGFAEVYRREDPTARLRIAHPFGLLQSLYVQADRRRAGVGRALTGAAMSWARARGATEMRVDTWEFPEGPVGFYEAQGYRTLRRTMVRGLENEEEPPG